MSILRKVNRGCRGVTLIELLMSMTVLTVGIMSFFGVYAQINKVIQGAKAKTLAVNLAQEKIESLKNLSYYRLLATSSTVPDNNFSPAYSYDTGYYPSETVTAGGIVFQRRVYVSKVFESGGNLGYRTWDEVDEGLKEIMVYVVWREGTKWKKVEVRNLMNDPSRQSVDSTIDGRVTALVGGANLSNARVETISNSSWYDTTDANGNYSFNVTAGSYTVRASKQGYFTAYAAATVASGSSLTRDFSLIQMDSGTISGTAYLRDHLVLSQVVGSSVHYETGFDQEWIEIFNPTSWTWTMGASATDERVTVAYELRNQATQILEVTYTTLTLPSGRYFLFANTTTIHAGGVVRDADAVFDASNTNYPNIIKINTDAGNDAAGIAVGDPIAMVGFDSLGWKTGGQNPGMYEYAALSQVVGLEQEEQFVRKTSSAGITSGNARIYDTGNNPNDFVIANPIAYPVRNSTDEETIVTGTPAAGAIVFANDGLSSAVTADSSGSFRLMSVATGTWTLTVSSETKFLDVTAVTMTANATLGVGRIGLTTASANGYITGRVTTVLGAGIYNIKVAATGALPAYTDASGYYRLSAATGSVEVIANPSNDNVNYVSASSVTTVSLGQVIPNVNFPLAQGGDITGYVSSNGTDPLPGVVLSAHQNGYEMGSAVSDGSGRFTILDLSTGPYILWAYPNSGETVTPSSEPVTVLAGQSVFSTTFTVSNAAGEITGLLTNSGAAIKTGVMIVATTSTITSDPPDMNNALRTGSSKYYQASSAADGRYSILVPGGYTYNVYGWYTGWSGINVSSTTRKNGSTAVAAGDEDTVDLSWP